MRQNGLAPSTMICFRAGTLVGPLEQRTTPSQAGSRCRQDLARYYWLLAVSLAGAPAVTDETLEAIVERVRAALSSPAADGDLTAVMVAAHDLLPDWSAVALFALADACERLWWQTGELDAGVLRARCGLRAVRSPPTSPRPRRPPGAVAPAS